MSPNTLAIQHEELQKTNSGFLYSPYLYARQEADKWVSTENTILNYYPFDSRKTLNHWMVRGLFLAIPAMLFRRDLINEVGPWSEQTTAYEDWDYCWRLGLAEPKPTHTNKCIFLYRQHGLQSTLHNSDDVKRDKEAIYVFEKILRENFKLYSTSVIESIWFKTKLYKILKKHKAEKFFYERFKRYNIPLYESFLLFDRLINKWQRSKTKSMWPGFYGPETSPHIINAYLATFTFTP
jgi:GT2 family glycosyltransferase